MREKLRVIPGFPAYRATENGKIYSTKYGKLKELKQCVCNRGYLRVGLYDNKGLRHVIAVHLLILSTFVGQKPRRNLYGLHRDDNKYNNHVDNLYWGTFRDNMDDRMRNGLQYRGERVHTSKLTESDVKEIRKLHGKLGYRRIAKLYGVTPNTIMYCVKRVSWNGVT